MKHNEESLERQSKLKESASRKEKKRQSKTSDGRGSSKQAEEPFPKRRRGGDRTGAANAVEPAEAESLVIVIPDRLKLRLIDDWNMVIKQSKLVELPKSPSITDIFDGYCDNVKGCGSAAESLALEVTSGRRRPFHCHFHPPFVSARALCRIVRYLPLGFPPRRCDLLAPTRWLEAFTWADADPFERGLTFKTIP